MQIEAGKFYKTRDGHKVGPMYLKYEKSTHPWGCDTCGYSGVGYRDNGERTFNYREGDIVSEWSDSPVREVTVTRREIVEGQYGGIYVMPDGPGRVTLGFDGHYVTFNAEQLAELEHLSAQLREALEDV